MVLGRRPPKPPEVPTTEPEPPPPPPAAVPPLPPPSKESVTAQGAEAQVRRQERRRGRVSTILTSPQGLGVKEKLGA